MSISTWTNGTPVFRAVRPVLPQLPGLLELPELPEHPLAPEDLDALRDTVGLPLDRFCEDGKPVQPQLIKALVELLAQLVLVRKESLGTPVGGWPHDEKDSRGFLRNLARHLHERDVRPGWAEFGGLFGAFGIGPDALIHCAERAPSMARRPYSLLNTDLRRATVLLPCDRSRPVSLDWSQATYGDPAYDLASHLVRMRYPDFQWQEVIDAWAVAMHRRRPSAVTRVLKDVRSYIALEQVRAVHLDVMGAARSLGTTLDSTRLGAAAESVRQCLHPAEKALGLTRLPDVGEVERALYRWQAARIEARHAAAPGGGPRLVPSTFSWQPDERVPERPDFPRSAVLQALAAEGAAQQHRVFKGTAHLNTVVRVDGVERPVVVRRKAGAVPRRESGFLSEHAVLDAIEKSQAGVRAPRVLALGTSDRGDLFAVHSYEGPLGCEKPPSHPVHGLLPNEADNLVDQLHALTRVDYAGLDPAAANTSFYGRLSRELVRFVHSLPKETQRQARACGLPNGWRLQEILGRHDTAPRTSVLLHGDLNPWNLVRGEFGGRLTIIDWELAMIGDPLYDLVRHLHLTPTRVEIRQRLFARWARMLPPEYTKGWEKDWRVYRWIELVRSAYVDLDRLETGAALDSPHVRRAVESYAMTLDAAKASLGLHRAGAAAGVRARR
ncbi:aminoglycoside phosphotransferase family protein [Streptomyces sp. NPDC088360]|uniref:aminoglycoside phosphotransferase family protein n=1 Tax=unclassified Streptomyces TaxID=2593676 RepID=UPI00344DB3CB